MVSPPLLARSTVVLMLSMCLFSCASVAKRRTATFEKAVSAHFTVYTDAGDARGLCLRLERILTALLDYGWEQRGKLPMRLNVVVLDDLREFQGYAGSPTVGGYYKHDVLYEPWVVLPRPDDEQFGLVLHELTHHLAFQALQNQPHWFAEGLAVYFETAELNDDGSFVLGRPHRGAVEELAQGGLYAHDVLLSADATVDDRFYASAWLLVHYLMSERADDFVRYQDQLAHGVSAQRAFTIAFPDLHGPILDVRLQNYLRTGEYAVYAFEGKRHSAAAAVSPLSPADKEGLRAVLWTSCFKCDRRVAKQKAQQRRASAHARSQSAGGAAAGQPERLANAAKTAARSADRRSSLVVSRLA